MSFGILGDVHGQIWWYKKQIQKYPHTVQVGDLGFYTDYQKIKDVDASKHVMIPGNHDDYDRLPHNCLGDFGVHTLNGTEFFFIRGAYSVDKDYRLNFHKLHQTVDKDGNRITNPDFKCWWHQEELADEQFERCMEDFLRVRPDVVISHDCPDQVVKEVVTNSNKLIPSRTGKWLQKMLSRHQPKHWYFGHHHETKTILLDGCRTVFQCIGEMDSVRVK